MNSNYLEFFGGCIMHNFIRVHLKNLTSYYRYVCLFVELTVERGIRTHDSLKPSTLQVFKNCWRAHCTCSTSTTVSTTESSCDLLSLFVFPFSLYSSNYTWLLLSCQVKLGSYLCWKHTKSVNKKHRKSGKSRNGISPKPDRARELMPLLRVTCGKNCDLVVCW